MQVSATLIAAQAAAREARARLAMPQAPQPGFAAALEKTEGFSPLPLKQAAASPAAALTPQPAKGPASARMGQHLDITV